MFRKIVIAVALLAMAGVASAAGSRDSGECFRFFGFELFCLPAWNPDPGSKPLRAPEIDPASAMAGLTMLVGGLAVLRGRRRKSIQE